MKHVIGKIGLLISTLSFAGLLHADGGRDGGGGGAILCEGRKPILLEFWEAEKNLLPFSYRFHRPLTINRSDKPVATQIKKALSRLRKVNRVLADLVQRSYDDLQMPGRISSQPGLRVEPPTDTMQPFYQEGCQLVGIGDFNDKFRVLSLDNDYLEQMSNTDQAAFWTHEAIYMALRQGQGNTNSVLTRFINAQLYSTEKLPDLQQKPEGPYKAFKCETYQDPKYFTPDKPLEFNLFTDGDLILVRPILLARNGGADPWPWFNGFAAFESSTTVLTRGTKMAKLLMRIGQVVTKKDLDIRDGFWSYSESGSGSTKTSSVGISDVHLGLQTKLYDYSLSFRPEGAGNGEMKDILISSPEEFKAGMFRVHAITSLRVNKESFGLVNYIDCTQY